MNVTEISGAQRRLWMFLPSGVVNAQILKQEGGSGSAVTPVVIFCQGLCFPLLGWPWEEQTSWTLMMCFIHHLSCLASLPEPYST